MALVAVAVYGADTFTAVNLLAYDKWSSQIEPSIPLRYSKWIFAACIMFSWVLCIFEWVRAIRVIRRGSVAESYMDSVAVTLQSMRPNGWKRFLVFAELTKSKKGVDYVALFVYFGFKGAVRIIFAEGPRQVVNAITLYSFMQTDLIPMGDHAATANHTSFEQFWINVETLAESNREQAVVLFTMLFTLVIWVISALCLIIAVILYLVFLWHYIPQSDGRLSNYCRRKIDHRLEKVVGQKVRQALEEQEKKQAQSEAKAAKKANQLPSRVQVNRKPTLPQVGAHTPDLDSKSDFGLPRQDAEDRPALPPLRTLTEPALHREQTPPSLNAIRPPTRTHTAPPMATHRQPPSSNLNSNSRPSIPYRSDTETSLASNATYASDASLLGNANDMGYSDSVDYYPTQPRPTFDRSTSYASRPMQPPFDHLSGYADQPCPGRSATVGPQQSQRWRYDDLDEQPEYERDTTSAPMNYPPTRFMTPYSQTTPTHQERMEYDDEENTALPQQRPQQNFQRSYTPGINNELSFASRHAPEPEIQSFEMQPRTAVMPEPFERSASAASGGYVAFNPSLTLAAAAPSFTPPDRSITSPPEIARPSLAAGPQRSATAPPEAYDGLIDEYRPRPQNDRRDMSGRSATAAPSQRHVRPMRSAYTAPYQPHEIPGRSASTAPYQMYESPSRSASTAPYQQISSRSASTAPLQPLYETPARSATETPSQRSVVPTRSATAAPRQPYEVPGRSATAAPQHYRSQEW
ncbi:unnamed protein product [Aureobasidium uvarum]|uniref:Pheromone-regulated membrane protein n=1 Tax=Aureobasidium uvarum TaxID=2773716 RepID=A0A9N8KX19_9PEZI|nr:unnamed protein product [Aureobasidium uvarum]